MEAPNPPSAVVPFQPATSSRPRPACGRGEGVFQISNADKYDSISHLSRSDLPIASSISSLPPTISRPPSVTTELRRPLVNVRNERKLRIFYQNVRGLRTKIDTFFLAASYSEYDVIVLTETWLDDCILSPQLFGSSFTVLRMDRSRVNSRKSRGGGVLIAVSSRHCCCIDPAPISNTLEQLWVKIQLDRSSVSIGVLYLPPDRQNDLDVIQTHADSIGSVISRLNPLDIAVLFGDYNQRELHWVPSESSGLVVDTSRSRLTAAGSALYDAFCFNGLTQTNPVKNARARTLDLVLVNEPALQNLSVMEAEYPMVRIDPDHPALDVTVMEVVPIALELAPQHRALNFKHVDYDVLNEALSAIDWQFIDSQEDLTDIVDMFTATIRTVIEAHVPLQRPPMKPAWANRHLRELKRRRRAAQRNYQTNRTFLAKQRFKLASNTYKFYKQFLYSRYIERTQRSLRRHPKKFWSFVRSKRKENGLPASMFLSDLSASTASSKCELFAEHFKAAISSSVATQDQIDAAIRDTTQESFDCGVFQVTEAHILSAIRKLKHSTCPGPDGIPPSLLKNCSNKLVAPLNQNEHFSAKMWRVSYRKLVKTLVELVLDIDKESAKLIENGNHELHYGFEFIQRDVVAVTVEVPTTTGKQDMVVTSACFPRDQVTATFEIQLTLTRQKMIYQTESWTLLTQIVHQHSSQYAVMYPGGMINSVTSV
ncbi:uncharacterized protein LOC129720502 [Wyeomyia smithii]|uniref:uncharacterized protein LOC129720502 n=1 Tax=Wyeomyia smithii TaxID=174621 RepID=UPI002467B867|nr:uncharacterized protein LOC129720502 [Wyeomyia smithii]